MTVPGTKPSNDFDNSLLSLNDVTEAMADRVAGKAYNLSRLKKYGFPVPEGVVLCTDVYDLFIAENHLTDTLASMEADITAENIFEKHTNEKISRVQNRILNAKFPDLLQSRMQHLLNELNLLDKPLAIRSSASLEDSLQASFAGIHDSFLNISGFDTILTFIKNCYASLWSARAISYRRKMQLPDIDLKIAVVLMELVDAETSGVAFSCDPQTGREDQLLINANYGLGETVVNGSVEPDSYLIDAFYLTPEKISLGNKNKQCMPDASGGVVLHDFTAADVEQCLNEKQLEELSIVVLRIFQTLGQGEIHQDIEWAFVKNKLYILQTRPVTAKAKYICEDIQGREEVWSNANLRDVVPMVLPFSVRFSVKRSLDLLMASLYQSIKYPIKPWLPFSRLINGRVYFNVTLIQWLSYDSMSTLPTDTNIYMGGHQPEIDVINPKKAPLKDQLKRLKYIVRYLRLVSYYRKNANKEFEKVQKEIKEIRALHLIQLSDKDLLVMSRRLNKLADEFGPVFIMIKSTASSIVFLKEILEFKFPGQGMKLANQLVSGMAEITTANMGYKLDELAELARTDDQVLHFFQRQPFNVNDWDDKISRHSKFYQAFCKYIEDYGHRGIYELDLRNPRWREDPSFLLNSIHKIIDSSRLTEIKRHQKKNNRQAWHEINEKFSPVFRPIIRYFLKQSIRGAELNEHAKSVYVEMLEPFRSVGLEAGRRLYEKGLLESVEDIWHCTFADMHALFNGYWDGGTLKLIVQERKTLCEQQEQIPSSDLVIDETPQTVTPKPEVNGDMLTGVGAACGKATGIANKVYSPEEGLFLREGDILVAPSTDPAWTPLFLNAKGIVMETGGYLSHGAIVAREYGIPAVVNVAGVMFWIDNGDVIHVNGNEGKVFIKTQH